MDREQRRFSRTVHLVRRFVHRDPALLTVNNFLNIGIQAATVAILASA